MSELEAKIIEFSNHSPAETLLPSFLTIVSEIYKLKEDIREIKDYLIKQEEDKHKPTYDINDVRC